MSDAPQLLIKLLNYIVEQAKDIDPRGFKISSHQGFRKIHSDLEGLPGINFNIQEAGDHTWLRVDRLEACPPPAFHPEHLRPFVTINTRPDGKGPEINEVVLRHHHSQDASSRNIQDQEILSTKMRIELDRAVSEYTPLWEAWAAGELPRRKTISLYGELFALKVQIESEETAKPQELVWGMGVSAWNIQHDGRKGSETVGFQYPLLTQAMELALNPLSMAIEMRPRAVDPRFEFDALTTCHILSAATVELEAKKMLVLDADRTVTPFDQGSFEPILKMVASNLHEKGRYVARQMEIPSPTEDLLVTDAWVILSRPRSNHYLHEDIERLKTSIGLSGAEIPDGALALVTVPSDEIPNYDSISFRGLSGGSSSKGEVRELFFPLPYNHEQVTIAEQLERSDGCAVQGPPGTGKTHTIANIVSHYLATGRKVLVTSKGEQALEVLQSKIPEEVRPLTVALLSGDREGMRQFQSSIETIIHNVSQLNVDVVRTQIATQLSAIDRAHTELAAIDKRVDEIAMAQLSDVEVDGVQLRAQKMADLVVSGHDRHVWFDDELTLDHAHSPPLTHERADALRESRRKLGKDLAYASVRIPASQGMLAPTDIARLHDVMVSMVEIDAVEAAGGLLPLRANTPEIMEQARQMLDAVEMAAALARELEESGEAWTFDLRKKCRNKEYTSERAALEALFGEIDALIEARASFLQQPVEIPEEALGDVKTREAVLRGAETGEPFSFLSFGTGEAKKLLSAVRISGLPAKNRDHWKHILDYLKLHELVLSFTSRWNQFAELLSVPLIDGSIDGLRKIELVTIAARKSHFLATKHDAHLPVLADKVFAQAPIAKLHSSYDDMMEVRQHLRRHLTRAELAEATTSLATLQEKLAGTVGEISQEFRDFIDKILGNPEISTERVVARYAELMSETRRIETLFGDFAILKDLTSVIERAGAGKWANRLKSIPVAASGEDSVLPVGWREAWNWARIRTHLNQIEARDELIAAASRRNDLEAGLAKLYEMMVSNSAWLSTKINASPKVLSALGIYKTAIQKIGQGTGPNATRYRRDAQKAMHDAQGAVPCWIMSHNKVSETLPAILGSFDLVIVDEASQSDLWALPAVLRGKKILVVGDDKQVSPDGGFVSAVRIQELRDRFLVDQPFAAQLTSDKSLYDIASAVFAAQKVTLREHFRCVPPIIAYSNQIFYSNFIQPLRIPKASERIDPPLVDIYVSSGLRDEKDINKLEAQAIAEEIGAILTNREFAGRTLGVVSLLGPDQAKYIDTLIRSRFDAAELYRRRFACGDARLFQGSERDIMFLSMVVSPNKCKALSGNMFEQRFNVAASRARDRMYLVRSVKSNDLSSQDLRNSLLSHFSKPMDGSTDESKSLVELCESGFERQVYEALFNRGYRVIPQVKAGAFRIDLVVEGANDSRLAIELDGDEFHGPDRWQADMSRQRVLERSGWTFWRCFASTWSLRREEVMEELLSKLTVMGIEPLGTLERIPSLVETRIWSQADSDVNEEDVVDKEIADAIASQYQDSM